MSADKRTVSTDALETLGALIGPNEKRDAIHLAVIPVEAGTELQPSQHITISGDKAYPAGMGKGMAIVDPFLLMTHVNAGQRFWAVIYPRVITSLRHVWTHPQLPDEAGASIQSGGEDYARQQLERTADQMGTTYEELIQAIDNGGCFQDTQPDYYSHDLLAARAAFRIVMGREPKETWGDSFSCSC